MTARVDASCVLYMAGRGQRLGPFSERDQKCALRVGDRPLYAYALQQLCELTTGDIAIVVGHASEHVWQTWVSQQHRSGGPLERRIVVAYDPVVSGTAGSVARGVMRGLSLPVVFSTPSAMVPLSALRRMVDLFMQSRADAVITSTPAWQELPSHPCVEISRDGCRVEGIRFLTAAEGEADPTERVVGSGILRRELADELRSGSLYEYIHRWARERRDVRVISSPDVMHFCTPADFGAERLIRLEREILEDTLVSTA